MSVTFETKVWENDWRFVVNSMRLEQTIGRCHYDFSDRLLYINNVKDRAQVERAADRLICSGILTRYVYVDDYADMALGALGLSREQLGAGYYYSIAELVSIYMARTDYLLHFSSDTTVGPDVPRDWLRAGIKTLDDAPNVKVFNLTWNYRYDEASNESAVANETCYLGYGFSDQMYLIRPKDFKQPVYGHHHPASRRYPRYGGDSFEKRVDSWMRQCQFLRATYRHGSYVHQNWPRTA
jgi:hypothetical protein